MVRILNFSVLSNCFGMTIDLLKVDVSEVLSSTNVVELEKNESQDTLAGEARQFEDEEEKEYWAVLEFLESCKILGFNKILDLKLSVVCEPCR